MKAKVKKLLSFVPVCLMLFGIMPAGIELPIKAQAAGQLVKLVNEQTLEFFRQTD
ncbi:MAG: hypothetical protein PUG93_07725 [Oscillospiraceae bacterium]|nr:hypothetical protein [Oscillospiraceae bacterium]MDY3938584.1 hypothetical protein [Oscillospiraceae bacterium]